MFSDFSATFLLSTAGFQIFQQLFCWQPPVYRFFRTFFTFNRWFKDFSATFCWQAFSDISATFFSFNRWFKDFSATFNFRSLILRSFLLSTASSKNFQQHFAYNCFHNSSATFLLATAGFQIFQQLFYSIWKQKSCWNIFKSAVES